MLTLNGEWKFRWSGDPARRPFHFWTDSFDVSGWETIDVPCCVELRGYGMPHYIAHGYPHKFAWPKILDIESGTPDYNPVMSYRRKFTLPGRWKGRETIGWEDLFLVRDRALLPSPARLRGLLFADPFAEFAH